jgi:hypothetical protein
LTRRHCGRGLHPIGAAWKFDAVRPTHGDTLTIHDVVTRARASDAGYRRAIADAGRSIDTAPSGSATFESHISSRGSEPAWCRGGIPGVGAERAQPFTQKNRKSSYAAPHAQGPCDRLNSFACDLKGRGCAAETSGVVFPTDQAAIHLGPPEHWRQAKGLPRRHLTRAVLVAITSLSVLAGGGALTALPAHAEMITTPSEQPETEPAAATVTLRVPAAVTFGSPLIASVAVVSGEPASPASGVPVRIQRAASGSWVTVTAVTTTADGTGEVTLRLPAGTHVLRAVADGSPTRAAAVSDPVTVRVGRARVVVTVANRRAVSEQATTLTARLTSPTAQSSLAGVTVRVAARQRGTSRWVAAGSARTDAAGVARLRVAPWRTTDYRVALPASANLTAAADTGTVTTSGRLPLAAEDPRALKPKVRYPQDPAPVGPGANARVSRIPDAVWRSMAGRSWAPGCPVGRSSLRHVSVNYWGFDGYRHRGEIVVHRRIAPATADIFTDLYNQRFRIRSMRLADVYGRNPKGPGANDYAIMAADNTSGFNCRYVVGKERRRVWSPHAYGIAIDINTWENPYAAPTGVFPNRYYLNNRRSYAGVLTSARSSAVRAFTRRGFVWGGRWAAPDYHHFQRR